jgi:hypothetical protein
VIDANVAAYATYSDGVLTSNKKLLEIYEDARPSLDGVFKKRI